jgi:hypothetical protein
MVTKSRWENRVSFDTYAILAACFLVGLGGPALPAASAMPFQLADGNSYINIETDNQATVYDWFVEDPGTGIYIDHLTELSNWFRIANTGLNETSVHTLAKLSQVASNTNADPRPDTLNVRYRSGADHAEIVIRYSIAGGLPFSGLSQLDEDIEIFNTSFVEDLEIHVFEYVDLDLHNTPDDDTIMLTGPNGLHQSDRLTTYDGSFEVDRHELDFYPNTVNKLMDANPDILNDVWPGGAGPIGPGNVTWALQWDFVGPPPGNPPGFRHLIPPRQSAFIHKEGLLQMYVIPEPASAALLALGCAMVIGYRPWRRI